MSKEQVSTEASPQISKGSLRHRAWVRCRQKESPYSLKGLLSLPTRLACPPPLPKFPSSIATSITTVDKKRNSKGFLNRMWTRSPASLIELTDVINNIHFSPLSAQDFEDFLVYDEFTPENLYFYHWFEAYTKLFEKENKKGPGETLQISSASNELRNQFEFGMKTFFSGGSLELNLPGKTVQAVKAEAKKSIEPSLFKAVEREVISMLEGSKRNWLSKQSGNANRNRAIFAISLGIACILGAIGLVLALLFFSHSRAVRIASAPLLWFGVMLILQGIQRTCIVIYAFGNLRQLHPWELMRLNSNEKMEAYTPSSHCSSPHASSFGFSTDDWLTPQHINLSTPVFCPVTKIESPLATRILRYNVISGASWAIPFVVIWLAVWIPQPILA